MTKELARTLTVALVSYLDENRPEGTMDCSSGECVSLEKAFAEENFDSVETLINKKLSRLTEFEEGLVTFYNKRNEIPSDKDGVYNKHELDEFLHESAKTLLALAKKQLLSYADESNPAIEAMADLERTFECNPDKLPGWLKDRIDGFKLEAFTRGYNKGYKDAEKWYNDWVAARLPIMPTTPSGWGCDGIHCINPHGDCINCPKRFTSGGTITTPNTASGISELKAEE